VSVNVSKTLLQESTDTKRKLKSVEKYRKDITLI
jgi:hypothetical protein